MEVMALVLLLQERQSPEQAEVAAVMKEIQMVLMAALEAEEMAEKPPPLQRTQLQILEAAAEARLMLELAVMVVRV